MNEEIFDAVMICIGHLSTPSIPDIPGMEKFQGVKVHSGDYRNFQPYVGKRVVVVGCGSSAGWFYEKHILVGMCIRVCQMARGSVVVYANLGKANKYFRTKEQKAN